MKRTLFILGLILSGIGRSEAQWAVYDAALHSQQIMATAQEIAKFAEVISKQVEQLRSLQEQAATLHQYVNLFGDPASYAPPSIPALNGDLVQPEVGTVLGDLIRAADPKAAMLEDGGGLYQAIGQEFTTPDGTRKERTESLYRPIAAIQETVANFLSVSGDAARRRVALKAEIARTTTALASARTDAEVQKLGAVLVGLGAALESTGTETSQATDSAVVQDIAARADRERQSEARREEEITQFTEALENYGRRFRLLNVPVKFPTR